MNRGECKDLTYKGKALWNALGRKPIDKEEIRSLLKDGSPIDFREEKTERTALHVAVDSGEVGLMKVLLEYGAQTNLGDKYGLTALHLAAETGSLEVVKLLMENPGKPADPNVRSQVTERETPLQCAAAKGHNHVVRYLDPKISGKDGERDNTKDITADNGRKVNINVTAPVQAVIVGDNSSVQFK